MRHSPLIYGNIDEKQICLCDLSKGIDIFSVSREIFLSKLINYKIDTYWSRSCLTNRIQPVKSHENISTKSTMIFGVLQPSISGPILFHKIRSVELVFLFNPPVMHNLSIRILYRDKLIKKRRKKHWFKQKNNLTLMASR